MERPEHFPTNTVRIDARSVSRASVVVLVDGRAERVRVLPAQYGTHWQYVGRMKDGRLVVGPLTPLRDPADDFMPRCPNSVKK